MHLSPMLFETYKARLTGVARNTNRSAGRQKRPPTRGPKRNELFGILVIGTHQLGSRASHLCGSSYFGRQESISQKCLFVFPNPKIGIFVVACSCQQSIAIFVRVEGESCGSNARFTP